RPAFVLLGLLLASTSLTTGLAADDHWHELLLRQDRTLPGVHDDRWDLFMFASGDPVLVHQQMDSGIVGWWADLELKIRFFRPLAAASHIFDYDVLGYRPVLMHAHSLLWFGLALAGVAWLYARFASPALAAAALF